MTSMDEVVTIKGAGLLGDRYASGDGSWNKGRQGHRQVTFVNGEFFQGTDYAQEDCRRNIVTEGIELMRLIGTEFTVGTVRFRGLKYCEPCNRPKKLGGEKLRTAQPFEQAFHDRGGLVAEVLDDGIIHRGDKIVASP